ncbi:MAG TPA: AmmeMemoRadiSam system protein B [Labilithrix sp.]
MNESVREPAVAGAFYPASRAALGELVSRLLEGARKPETRALPKAIVAPHAGYVYSGPIAASAFALLEPYAESIERVVLVGPAHRVRVLGLASPGADALRTPLGDVVVDTAALASLDVVASPAAHAREHSVEVELPFLQRVAPRARVVPLAVGRAGEDEVARVLEALWGGAETVIVVSSDLSHYLPYDEGRAVDERTAARIVALDAAPLEGEDACGCAGINGLLRIARAKGMRAELVDLRSSGDTAGKRDEVVGYGAFGFWEAS